MSQAGRLRQLLSQLLVHNFWLKFIAFIFAVSGYLFVHSGQRISKKVDVELRYVKPADDSNRKLIQDLLPSSVVVSVQGPARLLEEIKEADLSITLNLSAAENMPHFALSPEWINGLPKGVEIDTIAPNALSIKFENIIERRIKVQVARAGQPAKGMEIQGPVTAAPGHVVATGIESAVTTIQYARAESFDINGLKEGKHTRQLRLDDAPKDVRYDVTSISSRVRIVPKLSVRDFQGIRVDIIGLPRAKTKPTAVSIKVSGPPGAVEALTAEALLVTVDPASFGDDLGQPGSKMVTPSVNIADLDVLITPGAVLVSW